MNLTIAHLCSFYFDYQRVCDLYGFNIGIGLKNPKEVCHTSNYLTSYDAGILQKII